MADEAETLLKEIDELNKTVDAKKKEKERLMRQLASQQSKLRER